MMRISTIILLLLSTAVFGKIDPNKDACVQCHIEIDGDFDTPVMANIELDVHFQRGLSCSDCHGGDPQAFDDEDAAMWDNESFSGSISPRKQIDLCGKCHADPNYMRQYSVSVKTDQVAQYWTSFHGKGLKKGSEKVAVCTSCHGLHGIFPISDPRSKVYPVNVPATCSHCHSDKDLMAEFKFPTDQMEKYKSSVHGIALLENGDTGAPACNDCHGNHGASPPDVSHVSDICGTCHVNNQKLFTESKLGKIFLNKGLGQCEGCHENHGVKKPNDEYLNWSANAICIKCHDKDKPGDKAESLSRSFYQTLTSLSNGIATSDSLIKVAEQKGMEVSELYYHIEEAHRALVQSRTEIHSFDEAKVAVIAEPGLTEIQAAMDGAYAVLKDFMFRRKGLFVFSLIITFAAVTLYLKIKSME